MTDLAVREFVDQFGELPAYLVLDYIAEMSNALAGIPSNGAYIRLVQWLLAVKSGASDGAEYFSTITPPDTFSWLQELLEWPETPPMYSMTDALDDFSPGRLCHYCFHPRNSAECDFARKHPRYVEMFKGF